MLTRDQILSIGLKIVEVPTPEWDGTVFVRAMTGAERLRFEAEHANAPIDSVRERLVAATACDAEGNLLFVPEDSPALAKKEFTAMDRLFKKSAEINRLRAQDVDDLEKN